MVYPTVLSCLMELCDPQGIEGVNGKLFSHGPYYFVGSVEELIKGFSLSGGLVGPRFNDMCDVIYHSIIGTLRLPPLIAVLQSQELLHG